MKGGGHDVAAFFSGGPQSSVMALQERPGDRGVVPRDRVELPENRGSRSSTRFGDDRGLVTRAARRVRPPLYRQESAMQSTFGIVGFDHDEASRG